MKLSFMAAQHDTVNVLFTERIKLIPRLVSTLLFVLALIAIVLLILKNSAFKYNNLPALLAIFLLLIAILFSVLEIKLLSSGVLFYRMLPLQCFWKKIDLKLVQSITIVKQSALGHFLGYGIRINKNYSWSYIAAVKYRVTINLANKKKITLVVSNVKEFTAVINQLGINLTS